LTKLTAEFLTILLESRNFSEKETFAKTQVSRHETNQTFRIRLRQNETETLKLRLRHCQDTGHIRDSYSHRLYLVMVTLCNRADHYYIKYLLHSMLGV